MSITSDFLKTKAREISYALNRVSFYIKRNNLRQKIENLSFEFLESVAISGEDPSDKQLSLRVFKNISAIDVLVRIAHSLYEIEPVNANILIRELDSFNSAIRKFNNSASEDSSVEELPNLETMFSSPPAVVENSANLERKQQDKNLATIDKQEEIVEKAYMSAKNSSKAESGNNTGNGNNSAISGQTRQTLISEKIRQSGKINLKELATQLPTVSERTLRYDLHRLCDQGTVEKIGNSGPGTSYIAKEKA
ncbi:DeoR family transcriptional regulator [Patescibacteria group bacterium]|nr:DeoR family transcriptional regulator [Patescibacteria group bacterium]